jgi:hypothetical protein
MFERRVNTPEHETALASSPDETLSAPDPAQQDGPERSAPIPFVPVDHLLGALDLLAPLD